MRARTKKSAGERGIMRTMLDTRTISRVATWAILGLLWGCSDNDASTNANQMTEPPIPTVRASDLNLDRSPGGWLPENQLTDDINTEAPALLDDLFERTDSKRVKLKGRLLTAEDRENKTQIDGMEFEFQVKTK